VAKIFNTKKTKETPHDYGLSSRVENAKRLLRHDGSFNVERKGHGWHLYHELIHMSRLAFLMRVLIFYVVMNTLFAIAYTVFGVQNIGVVSSNLFQDFLNAFYFSSQTMTTVGYGKMSPSGNITSIIAAAESLVGLLSFALATGLLYGRFSKPKSSILFSDNAIVAPYREITGLMFRIANRKKSELLELEAQALLSYVDSDMKRKYFELELERSTVYFLPMNWTIVHPINKESPLKGKTESELHEMQAEIIVMIKGFDTTFSNNIHARTSYAFDEIEWGVKYTLPYKYKSNGEVQFDLNKLSETEPASAS
jgi:inward rectifier potassium channel